MLRGLARLWGGKSAADSRSPILHPARTHAQPRNGGSLAALTILIQRESRCALRSGVTTMARRSGYTLIEVSCGVTANGNRSSLTPCA